MKKTYDSDLIYFGSLIYNTIEGYYFSKVEAFEKVGDHEYKNLSDNKLRKEFDRNSDAYLSVGYLFPLSELLKDGERKEVSKSLIELYRLKYLLTRHFDKYDDKKSNVYGQNESKKKNK